ncbi:HdeD family acid-resistance protein [Vibrio sp. 404]|uniref:HdeD family acid-resistance protein n=1 Tax=Vibrio marinisediminis TaxID=2758441 RepID=A0A7W2FRS1_9VIBR|nr:HdeD family acid-resistance protein [Vibrio marinisediminis]MBA5763065.1 HdeD family acid-resistance protein [Vibrio marinisediminis]
MSDTQQETTQAAAQTLLSKGWKWFAIVGVLISIAGLGALSLPVVAGVTITTIVGGLFLFSGLVQAYHTFSIKVWKEKTWYVLSALLYIIGGLFILFNPFAGLITMTMLMVVVMMFNGATRMIFGFRSRSLPGSIWIIISGLVSLLIGGYFFTLLEDPSFSLSLLGTFVGVSLLIEGISFIFLGLQMKKAVE